MRGWFAGGCAMVCAFTSPLAAQATFEGCQDILGVPVASVVNPALTDIALSAVATLPPGQQVQPIIYFQPSATVLPAPLRRVIYFHECAHHALGHIAAAALGTPITIAQEQAADCWAIIHLVQSGELHIPQLQMAQAAFNDAVSGAHLPGPSRPANFVASLAASGVQPLP